MLTPLPRGQIEDAQRSQDALPGPASPLGQCVRQLEDVHIGDLREAIRANRVSFPSQVPAFTRHDRPDLPRKLAQLYFVLGWNYSSIGARYGLGPARVRQILDTWKRRAVKAGYIQHIPPAEVMSQLAAWKGIAWHEPLKAASLNSARQRATDSPSQPTGSAA